jgi:hypothetical protein
MPTSAPRRRLRDRLIEREGTDNPSLDQFELQNALLLIDDDLRETALALGAVEQYLAATLAVLDSEEVTAAEVTRLAADGAVLDQLDVLTESFANLRRRLGHVATRLK